MKYINYSPSTNYQDTIDLLQGIIQDVEDISIEDPNHEEVDLRSEIKSIEKSKDNILFNTKSSLESVYDAINYDLRKNIDNYIFLIDKEVEKDAFPFSDWIGIAEYKKQYQKNNRDFVITVDTLYQVLDFIPDTEDKKLVYIENYETFLSAVESSYPEDYGKYVRVLKNKKPKNDLDKVIIDHLLYGQINEIYQLVREDSQLVAIEENKRVWSKAAYLNLCNVWKTEARHELLKELSHKLNTEEEKRDLIDKYLLDYKNSPHGFSVLHNGYNTMLTDINFEYVQEIIDIDKELNLGCFNFIIEKLEQIVKSHPYSLKKDVDYQAYISFFRLSNNIPEKTYSKPKGKI